MDVQTLMATSSKSFFDLTKMYIYVLMKNGYQININKTVFFNNEIISNVINTTSGKNIPYILA